MVQNALTRTVIRSSKSVPASQLPFLTSTRPINKRISFQHCHSKLQGTVYTTTNLSVCQSSRLLRSTGQSPLNVHRMKTAFGRRDFPLYSSTPQIRNKILLAIRTSSERCTKRMVRDHLWCPPGLRHCTGLICYWRGLGHG